MGESSGKSDIHLDHVIDLLQSKTQKEKADGVKYLKVIFDRTQKASNLGVLGDKAYHKIYEVIFKLVEAEKRSYHTAKKNTSTAALNRLVACADLIRVVVKASASKLKGKTIDAVFDHISHTLKRPEGGFFNPLVPHYFKSLVGLFAPASNVEHLKPTRWRDIVDYCLEGINGYLDMVDGGSSSLIRSFSSLNSGTVARSASNGHNPTQPGSLSRQNVDELLQVLLSLVSVANAPLHLRYRQIADSVQHFLRLQGSSVYQVHQLAFSILNAVLAFTRSDQTLFTLSLAEEIIPVIIRFWQAKSAAKDEMLNSVRSEMLILLIHVHPHLEHRVQNLDATGLLSKMEDLADILRADYARRSDRDQLHIDDLEMADFGAELHDTHPFRLQSFSLRAHLLKAELNWAHLQVTGILERLIRAGRCRADRNAEENDPDTDKHPRKRQRVAVVFDRLLGPLRLDDENSRMAGLHILPFILHDCSLSGVELSALLAQLHICALDKRGTIASWALLNISCLSNQPEIANADSNDWLPLWHIGARSLTFAATCRAASAQLHSMLGRNLIPIHEVIEDMNAIVNTADTNGPVLLCDSAIFLMNHLLHARITEVPGASLAASQNVLRWLFSKWNPDDRFFAMHYAIHLQPHSLMTILRTCLGLPRASIPQKVILPCGPIAQAWQHHLNTRTVIRYLLLLGSAENPASIAQCTSCPKTPSSGKNLFSMDSAHFQSARKLFLELLSPKSRSLFRSWKEYTTDRSAPISNDVYRSAINGCVVILLSLGYFLPAQLLRLDNFQGELEEFSSDLVTFIADFEAKDARNSQALFESLLQSLQPYIPTCEPTAYEDFAVRYPQLLHFLVRTADYCKLRRFSNAVHSEADLDDDLMDIDDDFSTQQSYGKVEEQKLPINRDDLGLERDYLTFQSAINGRLIFLADMSKSTGPSGSLPSSFVDYLMELSDEELFLNRQLLFDILRSGLSQDTTDLARILEKLAGALESVEFDRCEVMQTTCLDVLLHLGPLWISFDSITELSEPASQIFRWFIEVALPNDFVSPETQKHITTLLLTILQLEPEYGKQFSMPSPRSSLFDLLEKGSIPVKFHIGEYIPAAFSHYLLKDHDSFFLDILGVLPSDRDWIEGLSLRLFVLAKIASKWPNLLRRCIYHILEIPGRIAESIPHGTKCIADITNTLEVTGPQEIFSLFAPQLLFTWCEEGAIEDIPFKIFGFNTLKDLVAHAQDELTGLAVMRGESKKISTIAEIIGINQSELLSRSFTKVVTYSIAHEISSPKSSAGEKRQPGEARVRQQLGHEQYFSKLNLHFADIIALMFNILDQESNIEKYFSKSQHFANAVSVLAEIKKLGASRVSLPPNQQPMFGAKYFPSEILHLCSRTQYELETLYTPALVASIARKLLNTIHPALGSLHKCSVLRKLRVLVAVAGKSALQGYPLEMVLQASRAFLVDSECADDAIGVIKYLLINGSKYLEKRSSFVAGYGISILGSLHVFLKSSQSSTTQTDQFQTTMSVAQKFRNWFGAYLHDYDSFELRGRAKDTFRDLVESAFATESMGNADDKSAESHLLSLLLKDEEDGGLLLSKSSRALALEMLCSKFRLPTSFRNDFLGDDELSVSNAAVVWKSCRDVSASSEYLTWAARVLGRAFAASGHVREELLQESSLRTLRRLSEMPEASGDSRASILAILQDLTLDNDQITAGLGEVALRLIVSANDESLSEVSSQNLAESLYKASNWEPYHVPPSEILTPRSLRMDNAALLNEAAIHQAGWLRDLSIGLAQSVPDAQLLGALIPILDKFTKFADQVFPFILHLALSSPVRDSFFSRNRLSKAFVQWLEQSDGIKPDNLKILLNCILYLRTQPMPNERSSADRIRWLEIDYLKAAAAATKVGMYKTALLFAEEHCTEPVKTTRRSSLVSDSPPVPIELLLSIFQNIDDPDMYYGVKQQASLDTILARFEYERDGPKSLAFRGAQFDSNIRRGAVDSSGDLQSLVKALDVLSLSGVSHSLLQSQQSLGMSAISLDSMFRTARKLEQWDIPVPPSYNSNAVTMYKALQAVNTSVDRPAVTRALNDGFESAMRSLVREDLSANVLHESLQTLAALVEIDEVLCSQGSVEFEEMLDRFQKRSSWMKTGRFDDISPILSSRATILSTLGKQRKLREITDIPLLDVRVVEVGTALLASKLNRAHNALQESLSLATSMIDLIKPCLEVGLNVDASIHVEAANTLWDQGEMASSIGMLQALHSGTILKDQTIPVGKSNLLSQIAYQVSVARLEKADKIIDNYLKPALKELKGNSSGKEAGEVFHQFAMFCDQQLQDPDGLEDLERLEKLRKNKSDEVAEYDNLIKNAVSSKEKNRYMSHQKKAETWLKLDEEELQRHHANRDEFLRQCLENYLLALQASDDHDENALRFSALWLEYSETKIANNAVATHLKSVPSRKFATLMNQLTSRLQETPTKFQKLLFDLVLRICIDHPYHGMYQVYAGQKNTPNAKDDSATMRYKAACRLSKDLTQHESTALIWMSLQKTNDAYCILANEKHADYKQHRKFSFTKTLAGQKLQHTMTKYKVPSPTMKIPLAPDLNYSKVPKMFKFENVLAIASGVSAPKIITAVTTDGGRYKQLVKGGNDDLRQDAIMEQVFEQVSELLKTNRSTRQRNLSIRTYKVLPLAANAGVIEFVANTIPLHDYLMPAHEKYNPKDMKGSECRAIIHEVASKSVSVRVDKFRSVCERFKPVMRHFFTEKFNDPDEWFAKRLAYTRSTAAISILGHILGLGDRHGHNILLDAKSGEVVHIDLGVAFEMGRVLPVPELVPFRLTRDIIDGMGITKTEGVFRRCCEFTLEALRKEVYSIMTILDVLRYDPLYSWSISPVRLARLQQDQSVAPQATDTEGGAERPKDAVNQPGEADRALTVVNKKLSKTLSVTATVNDLINQASDERNLAVLYSGWAAYV